MLIRARRWFNPYPDTPGSLRLGFVAAYTGVIGALVVYSNFLAPCAGPLAAVHEWALIGLLALLLFIERFELGRDVQPAPRRLAVSLLLARIVLVQGIVMLDCTQLGVLLYAVVPFAAFFVLGAAVSRLIGLAYWILVALRTEFAGGAGLQMNLDWLTVVVIFTLLLIFVHVIAVHIDRDQRSRQQMHQLLDQLAESHRQLQDYAGRVAELAAAAERNRLARDIHDSLGHYLTAISIQLEKAQAYRGRNPAEADRAIRDAQETARAALQDVRQSVSTLRDAGDRFSLRQSLAGLVGRMAGGPLEITWRIEGDETDYAGPVLTVLYRVAQEGLTNAQKHAQARHAALDVQLGETEARLRLHDDGIGFDPAGLFERAAAEHQGYGLLGLQERLEMVRGQMHINSDRRTGTEITVTVPKHLTQVTAT
ncbi:MAG: Sensor histidine kinase DesK [Chloroflexi bacterium ADurb.Bin325]|nr:MAG: Sensor histidine kinase DesK [Chloroflexi bacterium ADurb.Bin325]